MIPNLKMCPEISKNATAKTLHESAMTKRTPPASEVTVTGLPKSNQDNDVPSTPKMNPNITNNDMLSPPAMNPKITKNTTSQTHSTQEDPCCPLLHTDFADRHATIDTTRYLY